MSQSDSIHNLINLDDDDNDDHISPKVNSKYLDIKQFNSFEHDVPSSFGMFHTNIASLNAHIDDLKSVLSRLNFNFDVIGISEHKIKKDTTPSNNIKIPGYQEFVFEPTTTNFGGTGFYLKNNIDYNQRKDLQLNSPTNYESIFIEIFFPNKRNLIVGCIYRHPTSKIPVEDFTNLHLDPILHKISIEKKQCVIMGDFNIDLLKYHNDINSMTFFNNLSSHLFTPYILQPTRLTSKSLIDNIFFNSLEYKSNSGNLLLELSDHLIQFLILEGFVKKMSLPDINLYKRDLSNFNEREFEELVINGLDWGGICNLDKKDPQYSLKEFIETLNFYLDEMAPYKKVTKKEYKLTLKPWITEKILQKCKIRDSILKSISKENDPVKLNSLRNDYKQLRNEITKEKRIGKKAHYTSYFEKNKLKSAKIWQGIRSLVNVKAAKVANIKL